MVLADTIKRWNGFASVQNIPTYLTTGTDEHGLKVQQASAKAGVETKAFVDNASKTFKTLADAAHISYDRFIRTTDIDHIDASRQLWKILEANGYIYKGQHSGWYSVSDETFYPESQIEKNILEDGSEQYISIETGKTVEWSSEENYFFALSKIQPQLLDHIEKNKDFVFPKNRYDQILREVKEGLSDLSISRPKSRCSWGIPVPGAEDTQVMYVWLDALTNYLTSAGFPNLKTGSPWPADVHVIGKDIIRFHAIYWPAFLLAAGMPLPSHIVAHSHWTMKGSKMSKSLGNVVDPIQTLNTFGVDSVKFFLMNDSFLSRDSDYSNDRIVHRHNTELVNKYGNLVVRVCGKAFNIPRALLSNSEDLQNKLLVDQINELQEKVKTHMKNFSTAQALSEIWSLISAANSYVQESEPWTLKSNAEKQDAIIKDVCEAARVSSILLIPFIPEISSAMLDRLEVDQNKRSISFASYGSDTSYGKNANRKGDYPIKSFETD